MGINTSAHWLKLLVYKSMNARSTALILLHPYSANFSKIRSGELVCVCCSDVKFTSKLPNGRIWLINLYKRKGAKIGAMEISGVECAEIHCYVFVLC